MEHTPNGSAIDAFSTNHFNPIVINQPVIRLEFSVDRLTTGLPGSASLSESGFSQQSSDIYSTTVLFPNPAGLVGLVPPGPPVVLPSAGAGGSNVLAIDESTFGLTTIAGVVPPGVPAGPILTATHDNINAFDSRSQIPDPFGPPPAGVYTTHSYFAITPDEAAFLGASAADIFDTAAGATGTVPIPYAPAGTMGLDLFGPNTDSIDALIVFDAGIIGGLANTGPGAEPLRDFALFSLAPGSTSLTAYGLSAGDIFFTDFAGSFGIYAFGTDIGLLPDPGGGFPFQNQSNVDALTIVPEPSSLALIALGIGVLARRRRL